MIEYTRGDILTSEAEALVNTVNCVGIMGRGVALQFKNAYPENFAAYATACRHNEVQVGRMFVFETGRLNPPRIIINFPTKRHWKGKSRLDDIIAGLSALVEVIRDRHIRSIAMPPLGSGLGGLDWIKEVRPQIEKTLGSLTEVHAFVYEPHGAPRSETLQHRLEVPNMTPGRAALVQLIARYLNGLLDPFVSLLEVHKLMYFMQETGEPLSLRYKAAPYGPYAENLRHVLHAIEGHFVVGYDDGGDAPGKALSLVPGAAAEAHEFLEAHSETRERVDRVASLVSGFESPYGLELLSTVHWVIKHGGALGPQEVISHTYAWGERKKQFTARQIKIAADVLVAKGWIAPGAPDAISASE